MKRRVSPVPKKKSHFKWRYKSEDEIEKRRYELYSKFALAQSHMGIESTLSAKRRTVGYTTLANCPVEDFEWLIDELKSMFKHGDYYSDE